MLIKDKEKVQCLSVGFSTQKLNGFDDIILEWGSPGKSQILHIKYSDLPVGQRDYLRREPYTVH